MSFPSSEPHFRWFPKFWSAQGKNSKQEKSYKPWLLQGQLEAGVMRGK